MTKGDPVLPVLEQFKDLRLRTIPEDRQKLIEGISDSKTFEQFGALLQLPCEKNPPSQRYLCFGQVANKEQVVSFTVILNRLVVSENLEKTEFVPETAELWSIAGGIGIRPLNGFVAPKWYSIPHNVSRGVRDLGNIKLTLYPDKANSKLRKFVLSNPEPDHFHIDLQYEIFGRNKQYLHLMANLESADNNWKHMKVDAHITTNKQLEYLPFKEKGGIGHFALENKPSSRIIRLILQFYNYTVSEYQVIVNNVELGNRVNNQLEILELSAVTSEITQRTMFFPVKFKLSIGDTWVLRRDFGSGVAYTTGGSMDIECSGSLWNANETEQIGVCFIENCNWTPVSEQTETAWLLNKIG